MNTHHTFKYGIRCNYTRFQKYSQNIYKPKLNGDENQHRRTHQKYDINNDLIGNIDISFNKSKMNTFIRNPKHKIDLSSDLNDDLNIENTNEFVDMINKSNQNYLSSNVRIGTELELVSKSFFEKCGFILDKVGGKGDMGMDLIGYFDKNAIKLLKEDSNNNTSNNNSSNDTLCNKKIEVLAQCKRYKIKIGPSHIREMLGVLNKRKQSLLNSSDKNNIKSNDLIGLMVGYVPMSSLLQNNNKNKSKIIPCSFSEDAIKTCLRTPEPIVLVTLSWIESPKSYIDNDINNDIEPILISWISNRQFNTILPELRSVNCIDQIPPKFHSLFWNNHLLINGTPLP